MAQNKYEKIYEAISETIAYLESRGEALKILDVKPPILDIEFLTDLQGVIEMVRTLGTSTRTGGELIDIVTARRYRKNFTDEYGIPEDPAARFQKRMVKVSAPLLKQVLEQKDEQGANLNIDFIQIYPILKDDRRSFSLLLVAEAGGSPVIRSRIHPEGQLNILEELEPCPQPPCPEL